MEMDLTNQIRIIEQEQLMACKAKFPKLTFDESQNAIYLENQDLRALCKLAKSNETEVILYDEKRLKQEDYFIDKEIVCEEYEDVFSLLEADIDNYNLSCQELDFTSAKGGIFYFVFRGKYFIQEIEYIANDEYIIPSAKEKLHEIICKKANEIEKIRIQAEEERRQKKLERDALLNEFLRFVRKDAQFVLMSHKEYIRMTFGFNSKAEKYKSLFFAEEDRDCQNPLSIEKCCRELEQLSLKIKQERVEYRQTEEYATRMSEFKKFVKNDPSFWAFTFPGHRRDYAYQVFLSNPKAEKFRTLFYDESDVECKDYDARKECYYLLERLYIERTEAERDK